MGIFQSLLKVISNGVKGLYRKVKSILSGKNPTNQDNPTPCDEPEDSVVTSVERPRHVGITIPELGYSSLDDCTSASDQEDEEYFVEEFITATTVDAEEEDESEAIKNAMLRMSCPTDHEERWIKHYSNRQLILLVGEGDFSFSSSLAVAFGFAPNVIATSLDSEDFLKKHYQKATLNIEELRSRGSIVMHGIDATKMAGHALLGFLSFDRVVYNFPFAGFFKDMSRESQLRLHKRLISLFLKNAKKMISSDGEIHITHKTNGFHSEWNIEYIASLNGLRMIEAVRFNHYEYPRYRTKCGFGGDNNFNCNPSKTYKFGLVV